eukprot:scaffold21439_cov129-Isochrysis_galbana.AAC.4
MRGVGGDGGEDRPVVCGRQLSCNGLGISHDGGTGEALGVVLHVGTGAGGGAAIAIVGAINSGGAGGALALGEFV